MRPIEFNPEQIIEAGIELQAAGRNITGFALRQKVGGGNPNRLKQVWDEHLAAKNTTEAEPVAELPIEVAEEVAAVTKSLTERLATLAVELNNKAVKAAERRVTEVLRTAGEQREQAERELVDAAQAVDELEAQLDETRSKAESLEQRLSDSLAIGQSQAVELALLRERLAATEKAALTTAENHVRELDEMKANASKAGKDLETISARLEQAKAETMEAREVAARLTGQMDAMKEQNAALLAAVNSK
jgi:colicin import membrane protein